MEQSQKHRLGRNARVLSRSGYLGEVFHFRKRRSRASAMAEGSSCLEAGLELGETQKIRSPESVRRYAMRQDGTYYGAHLEKVFQERRQVALKAMDDAGRQQAARLLLRRATGWPSWPSPAPFPQGHPV
jgi:hypothetical protein